MDRLTINWNESKFDNRYDCAAVEEQRFNDDDEKEEEEEEEEKATHLISCSELSQMRNVIAG